MHRSWSRHALLLIMASGFYRKEEDKFNVWLAYLNLENTYGEPPEEAGLALFQRAVQAWHAKQSKLRG